MKKLIKVSLAMFALTVMFWFWFPRHYRLMQHIGAVIDTHQTPTTSE